MVRIYQTDTFCLFETKADVKKVSTRLQFLGYPYTSRAEHEGYVAGIWQGWKSQVILDALASSKNYVCCIKDMQNKIWIICFIYSTPNAED